MARCLLLLLPLLSCLPAPAQERPPAPSSWLIELRPVRATFDADATDEEQALVGRHFQRLTDLFRRGKVALAGRCMDEAYGLVLVREATEPEAREIMEGDPCVEAGVFVGRMHPYRIAMMNWRDEGLRRPEELSDLEITLAVDLPLGRDAAYERWSTVEGLKSFFASDARIGRRPGDPYEIYLLPEGTKGPRGGEGCRLLAALPGRMLAFEWRAPPSLPNLRPFVSTVVLLFEPRGEDATRVRLVHRDFGTGEEWKRCHIYFERAWPYVLRNLKKSIAETKGE